VDGMDVAGCIVVCPLVVALDFSQFRTCSLGIDAVLEALLSYCHNSGSVICPFRRWLSLNFGIFKPCFQDGVDIKRSDEVS
jgi:hypothetical protein